MAKPVSSAYIHILGEPVSKRSVYVAVASFVVLLIALLGGGYYMLAKHRAAGPQYRESMPPHVRPALRESFQDESEVAPVSVAPAVVSGARPDSAVVISLPRLLDLHMEATGFDSVTSFILNGQVAASGSLWELTLMAREPNLYKLKTKPSDTMRSIEYGYDGERVWAGGFQPDLNEAQFEFYMSLMVIESSITHLAWSYRSDAVLESGLDAVFELGPTEVWNGQRCAVVISRGILPIPITHYIDLNTYEEVYRRAIVTGPTGEPVEVELRFTAADGRMPQRLPAGYELYVDGELHDTVTFSQTRVNRMMLSSLFDAPSQPVHQSNLR
jgi:hypothetical protein